MRAKWYLGTLLLIFTLFGAFQEQISKPNQEIFLEFVDAKINPKDIKNTIVEVKSKLLKIGATNIAVQKTNDSSLKISYYSLVDVNNIKDALIKKHTVVLDRNSKNEENNNTTSNYNLDVYELTDFSEISDVNDKFVFEIKYNPDRFTTNHFSASLKNVEACKANQFYKTACRVSKNNPFTKDKTSHKEPEVRAGPLKSIT